MLVAHLLMLAWAVGVALIDIKARRIPNGLSLAGVVIGLGYAISVGHGVLGGDWADILLGLLLAVLLSIPAYLRGVLGAGDAKLMLAIGVLGGWKAVLLSFAFAGVLGSITIFAMMQYSACSGRAMPAGRWMPFGAMLSMGLIASMGLKW